MQRQEHMVGEVFSYRFSGQDADHALLVLHGIGGHGGTRRANTGLLVIADYDMVNDRLANPRLDDGTPLSAHMLADLAVDARALPAVFSADWSQLALGRTRNASDAQRLVLAARDEGCISCDQTSEHTTSSSMNTAASPKFPIWHRCASRVTPTCTNTIEQSKPCRAADPECNHPHSIPPRHRPQPAAPSEASDEVESR